jgi:N6-L-threonylcarbamoyladenine synthase
LNQAPYLVKGFRLFDKVKYNGVECFISGRRSTGYFKLIKLDGTVIHNSAKSSTLKLLEKKSYYLTEKRRKSKAPRMTEVTCLRFA